MATDLDDIKKKGKGNIDGVSFWTCGGCLCDGQNSESGLRINAVLGVDGVVLPVTGC
jgi:hypothetical protein